MKIELDNIYNMDCLEGMRAIPDGSVDCIICDLPYEVLNKGNANAQWDRIIPFDKLWEQYLRIAKPNAAIVLFCQGMFTAQLMMSQPKIWRYNLVWDKVRVSGFLNSKKMFLRQHEDIAVFYRQLPTFNPQKTKTGLRMSNHNTNAERSQNRCYGDMKQHTAELIDYKLPTSIIRFTKQDSNEWLHPTQKPVDLIAYLVRTYSNEGDTILDNCMGSGTTAIACIREHRHYIGFELNEEYFDKACERIRREQLQTKLF